MAVQILSTLQTDSEEGGKAKKEPPGIKKKLNKVDPPGARQAGKLLLQLQKA